MLGCLFIKAGNEGSRVIDNYNLLFAILIHQGMTTMMLTVLTCKFLLFSMGNVINELCDSIQRFILALGFFKGRVDATELKM